VIEIIEGNIPAMRYKKNNNFEEIRQHILGLLNSYDWENVVVDNSTQVKDQAISMIQTIHDEQLDIYENMKDEGLTLSQLEAEGVLRGVKLCLNELKEYL
jgi:hypothetical protein